MINRHFLTTHIAGFAYYDGIDVIEKLKIGTELRLKAEPTNPHDADAVAIYLEDAMLGYIPSEKNEQISQFLQLGYDDLFEVKINRLSLDVHPEKQFGIVVRIREKNKI
ncbi:restriction endonuclease [Bacteroidia bacterium]|nr:restriction endonuclease [Bacteroidia bacterium]